MRNTAHSCRGILDKIEQSNVYVQTIFSLEQLRTHAVCRLDHVGEGSNGLGPLARFAAAIGDNTNTTHLSLGEAGGVHAKQTLDLCLARNFRGVHVPNTRADVAAACLEQALNRLDSFLA